MSTLFSKHVGTKELASEEFPDLRKKISGMV